MGGRVFVFAGVARWPAIALAGVLCLTGCGADTAPSLVTPVPPVTPTPTPAPSTYSGAAFSGKVMAGSQPVVGAAVQLYAAGTTGNGSAGTALLTTALTTDSSGAFNIAAGYGCPLASSVLYVVATGGRVGSGAVNALSVLLTSPGACASITSGTSLTVNEATTVGSAFAMAQFLGTGAKLGASTTNIKGLTQATATLASLVNLQTGAMPGAGFPSTGTVPAVKLGTLANALNACLAGGSGSSACSQLLSAGAPAGAAQPATALDAMVNVAQKPSLGTAALYALSAAASAYPELSAAPADWAMFVTYKGGGMNNPSAVSIDSNGRVWVANYFGVASLFSNTGVPVFPMGLSGNGLGESFGGAVDANDAMWITNRPDSMLGSRSTVSVFSAAGTAQAGSPYSSGGLYYPVALVFDTTGVAYVVNYGNSRLVELDTNGASLSGATGYDGVDKSGTGNFIFPTAVAVDSKRNAWLANQASNTVTKAAPDGSSYTSFACCQGASGVAIDGADNVWVANYYGDSVGLVSSTGSILSGNGYIGASLQHPQGIAVDGTGNVWVASFRGPGLTQLAAAASASGAGTLLSPAAGWAAEAAPLEAYGLAIDASGNVWVTGFGNNVLVEYIGMAAPGEDTVARAGTRPLEPSNPGTQGSYEPQTGSALARPSEVIAAMRPDTSRTSGPHCLPRFLSSPPASSRREKPLSHWRFLSKIVGKLTHRN